MMDWRLGLPVLRGPQAVLREPKLADATALFRCLSSEAVKRFIATPPSTPEGFERFILWVQNERQRGRHVCFAIVPDGSHEAVGLIQVRETEAGFGTAEWGFALSEEYWGTDLFRSCALRVLDFAVRVMRVHRIEARASVSNGRGNGALQKLGAIPEGILRQSFANETTRTDQVLWSIIAHDWLAAHPTCSYDLNEQVVQAPELDLAAAPRRPQPAWRQVLPVLTAPGLTMRELRLSDAATLAAMFADPEVRRYIPPPPGSAAEFERFIEWTWKQRTDGTILCFGVVPEGSQEAIGLFQLHELEPPFRTVEWGFALGRPYWGRRLFDSAARILLSFAFDTLETHRIEARVMATNTPANMALRRLGAAEEGHLRRSFLLGGEYHDDILWALLDSDWRNLAR